ncbi:hypothetical protein CPC08DRAFT_761978 [Agrocybe pediades]|nr:hypothetical protein CPC08DRAFT_761978 [Agrocybe pediades]
MLSFGGTPLCPRCTKPVYLAEQAMGPGRKLYHKPCLACTICNKRLDSYNLLEHDEQPYCKSCHLKNFGTRDLRHANLPYAQPPEDISPTSSPQSSKASFPPAALVRPLSTGNGNISGASIPKLRPNRSLATSPISPTFPRRTSPPSIHTLVDDQATSETPTKESSSTSEEETEVGKALHGGSKTPETEEDASGEERDSFADLPDRSGTSYPSNIGRPGIGTIPRTIPLSLNSGSTPRRPYKHHVSQSLGSISVPSSSTTPPATSREAEDVLSTSVDASPTPSLDGFSRSPMGQGRSFPPIAPLGPMMTGSRYGVALGGNVGGGVAVNMTGTRKWGAGTPSCPRCGKSVYFAEQVKAVGKTFHKGCLRCMECNSSLDSNRLRDHNGEPFCVRCYSKLHGPQGGGYALLGKAGG